jgi:hypothetical protein
MDTMLACKSNVSDSPLVSIIQELRTKEYGLHLNSMQIAMQRHLTNCSIPHQTELGMGHVNYYYLRLK